MSTKQAAAYINLEIYEDSVNLLGVAKVKLPAIAYPCVNISGAGMMGEMEVPLYGMVSNMTTKGGGQRREVWRPDRKGARRNSEF